MKINMSKINYPITNILPNNILPTSTSTKITKKYNYKKKQNGLNATGRPTKYKTKYCQDIIDYFTTAPKLRKIVKSAHFKNKKIIKEDYIYRGADLPTISKFAFKLKVNTETIYEWAKKHPQFSNALKITRDLYKDFLNDNALTDFYNPIYSKFVAINTTDMREKNETDINIKTYEQFKKQKEDYGFIDVTEVKQLT